MEKSVPAAENTRWIMRSVFPLGMCGAILLWASLPPLGFFPLGWLAPLPWLVLILLPQLPGKRPYFKLTLVGFGYWLVLLQGIRLAHWGAAIGWVALSLYLAIYLPLFVALARGAVHRFKIPLPLAAPAAWVGLEYIRSLGMLSFSAGLLAHSQYKIPLIIQWSDLAGGYGLSFAMMATAACLACILPLGGRSWRFIYLVPASAIVGLVLAYGFWKSSAAAELAKRPVKIALIQASFDTTFNFDLEEYKQRFNRYSELSWQATADPAVELIVWPESMFPMPLASAEEDAALPAGMSISRDEFFQQIKENDPKFVRLAESILPPGKNIPLLVGCERYRYAKNGTQRYNSVVLVREGEIAAHYDKTHPVLFGEYVPLGEVFPWLYHLMPMSGGLTEGTGPQRMEVAGLSLSPSICFESTVGQLIRRQVVELERAGKRIDLLVNVTNDGWFWGSSILDIHLACNVFRAVENRKPMVIAANTGISAWIDSRGKLQKTGPRRGEAVIIAEVQPDNADSLYTQFGDWLPFACLCYCAIVAGGCLLPGKDR